jgi:DNA-binding response OmpR family regulator
MAERILVFNDNQDILDLFREVLEGEGGYEVILSSFMPGDLAEIIRIRPDLVILDFIFGSENLGWQLLQKMRMRHETAHIPVIICTAATRAVQEITGQLAAHGAVVVPKPFDIGELLDAVHQSLALRGSMARQQRQQPAADIRDAETEAEPGPSKPAPRRLPRAAEEG